jgi:hypothetical protein
MQSENGILLLFYIFLSHGNERKKKERERKRGVGCKKGIKGRLCLFLAQLFIFNFIVIDD